MFPSLPNELIVRILDILASSNRQSCLALCLVSSWTRRIALPHLLHTVVVKNLNCISFIEGVINTRHASYVKRLLLLMGSGTQVDIDSFIITSCASITALVASPYLVTPLDNCPPFQFLTHLCIVQPPFYDTTSVKLFPQLTHFAGIVYLVDNLVFHRTLLRAYGTQLIMVVVMVPETFRSPLVEWVREMRKTETNVFIKDQDVFSLGRDWGNASVLDSVWDRARRETRIEFGLDGARDDS